MSSLDSLRERFQTFFDNLKLRAQENAEARHLEEEIEKRQHDNDKITRENNDLREKLKERLHENEILQKKWNGLQESISENEKKCKEVRDGLIMKKSDNSKMIKAREMLNIGIAFTGVRWDYSAPDNITRGYIANKNNGILKPFEYDTNKENLQTELWNCIQSTNTADWTDLIDLYNPKEIISDKENLPTNIN